MTENLADLFGSTEDSNDILSLAKSLTIQAAPEKPQRKARKSTKKKATVDHNPYVKLARKKDKNRPTGRLYVLYDGMTIHVTDNKAKAHELSRNYQRDFHTIRSSEYMWVLKPGFKLKCHGLSHGKVDFRPDGTAVIQLEVDKDTLRVPMTYTAEELLELREKFARFAGPSIAHVAKRKELIRYILDSANIVYTVKDLGRLQQILSEVFTLDMEVEVGFNYPETPPVQTKIRKRRKKSSRLLFPERR